VSELGLSRRSCWAADWERRTDHHESREWTTETNACLAGDGGPLETANVAIRLEGGKDSAAEMRVFLGDRDFGQLTTRWAYDGDHEVAASMCSFSAMISGWCALTIAI